MILILIALVLLSTVLNIYLLTEAKHYEDTIERLRGIIYGSFDEDTEEYEFAKYSVDREGEENV